MEKELTELAPWANKLFTGSGSARLPVVVQDVGVLPKGAIKTVRVKMTNIYAVHLQMEPPMPVKERAPGVIVRWPNRLDPKQTGFVEVEIDTRGLDGEYAVRVPVLIWGDDPKSGLPVEDPKTGHPFMSQTELVIRFVSR